jgi:hypothetical protein
MAMAPGAAPLLNGQVPTTSSRLHTKRGAARSFTLPIVASRRAATPPQTPDPRRPRRRPWKLEYLDDLVFEAIRGETTALEELKGFWPDLLHELGEQLLAESRQQYLRYALQIWETAVQPDGLRNPSRAMQALDVLCVLFNESL